MQALENRFSVPDYLLRMVRSYLEDRRIVFDSAGEKKEKKITAGAAQGSILGPDLWNVAYDDLLQMAMPDGTFLVGYADDVAAVITARSIELAQLRLNQVMRRVSGWMDDHRLQLALEKTEIVILTRRRIPTCVPFAVGTSEVASTRSAKYLGVTIDSGMTFAAHIRRVSEKAAQNTKMLSRLMANVGGPRPARRRLLMLTTQSILLYGAEIWADALLVKKFRSCMASIQRRGALRIASCYRTVSEPAALVVAGVFPIDILARERKAMWKEMPRVGRAEAARSARDRTIQEWQRRWQAETRGRWTARLIPDVAAWTGRSHGEVNFYVTQFLTGHGYFRDYLHRMGKVSSPYCSRCNGARDDVAHAFFSCRRCVVAMAELQHEVGVVTADNVVEVMLRGKREWSAIQTYIWKILQERRTDGTLNP